MEGSHEHGNEPLSSIKRGNFLTVRGTISFSRTLFHWVSRLYISSNWMWRYCYLLYSIFEKNHI